MKTLKNKKNLLIGCVADDFTGGSDAASYLSEGGMETVLISGIPDDDLVLPEECEAVVIALKSRTQKTEDAVRDSLKAVRWLKNNGTEQFYFKYCSTFDSLPTGNIGPVCDALMEELNVRETVLLPSMPDNGRTVKNGILYVNGIPLEESSMRSHPLTPMTKSRISELMEPQGRYPSLEIHQEALRKEDDAERLLNEFRDRESAFYIIPDYENETDAEHIVSLFGKMRFLTGGSGILKALASGIKGSECTEIAVSGTAGRAIIVAGSCSSATRAQELYYENSGSPSIRLKDEEILSGKADCISLYDRIVSGNLESPLVYSYDTPEGLAAKRNEEGRLLAAKAEYVLSSLAAYALETGFRRIISAGGETSGAVTQALGFRAFRISGSVASGVPILIPLEAPDVRLVLKSGNFGQEDFFCRALKLTGVNDESAE